MPIRGILTTSFDHHQLEKGGEIVLHWLNLNSGAIQALTSVLTLAVTGVLAIITWR